MLFYFGQLAPPQLLEAHVLTDLHEFTLVVWIVRKLCMCVCVCVCLWRTTHIIHMLSQQLLCPLCCSDYIN